MRIVTSGRYLLQVGQKFHRLTVLGQPFFIRHSESTPAVVCECRCGILTVVRVNALKSGTTKSCGCLGLEAKRRNGYKRHIDGRSNEKLYAVYHSIRKRCKNPNDVDYADYGGRGISVCKAWDRSYPDFKNWALANGYEPGLTIERNDVNGNYEPGNCCWITMQEQAKNKRNTRVLAAFGETKTLLEWLKDERCIATESVIRRRLGLKWTTELAISTKVRVVEQWRRRSLDSSLG